ncbi:MAG: hypothetical protein AAFX06_20595 [Planctomycetota bacterium]
MPKWSLFSFGKRPSPELLAGEGPTTSYPAPPSASSTPNAISSVAGGVTIPESPAIAPGVPTSQPSMPGMGLAASGGSGTKANLAAAQANGYPFATASSKTASTPGYTMPNTPNSKPSSLTVPSIPTGYQFGTRSTPPGAPSFATNGPAATSPALTTPPNTSAPSLSLPGSQLPPTSGFASTTGPNASVPSAGLSVPPISVPSTTPAATPGGFALPAGIADKVEAASSGYEVATNPKPFTPKLPALPTSTPAAQLPPAPSSTTPTISTASATLEPSSTTPSVLNSGYAPGSTSGSSSYPSGGYPSTGNSGTFYR